MDEKRKQVADQCRVVAHLARALATVNEDYAETYAQGPSGMDELLDGVGNRTARHMNLLGDILNGMDAVTEEDEWTDPIFHEARRMFPQPKSKVRTADPKE